MLEPCLPQNRTSIAYLKAHEVAKGVHEAVLDGVSWQSSMGEEDLAALWAQYSMLAEVLSCNAPAFKAKP